MSAIPSTMQAWEIRSAGGIDALELRERECPRPGPGEVLVRIGASALNYRDLSTVRDPAARGIPYPRIPNSDGAGEILALGPGVTRWRTGQRVAACFFQRWADGGIDAAAMASALGGARDGVLCEYAVFAEDAVVGAPRHLDPAATATLPCAGLTAWHCLAELGGLRAGQTALLLGTGGVSVFALQFAALHGVRAIVTSSRDDKLERAAGLGAWRTINYRTEPEWDARVLELTEGAGVDLVLETGGAGTLPASLNAVRVGGTVALIGVLTSGQIDPTVVMRKSIRLQGVYVGHRRMFERMNQALSAHRVQPVIDRRFGFAAARDAFHYLESAQHFGKVVIEL